MKSPAEEKLKLRVIVAGSQEIEHRTIDVNQKQPDGITSEQEGSLHLSVAKFWASKMQPNQC